MDQKAALAKVEYSKACIKALRGHAPRNLLEHALLALCEVQVAIETEWKSHEDSSPKP